MPVIPVIKQFMPGFSGKIYKFDVVHMKQIKFYDDLSVLLSDSLEYLGHSYDNMQTSYYLKNEAIPPLFYEISFSTLKFIDVYYRRYTKFQELLANLGGVLKGLMFFGTVLSYHYSTNSFIFQLNKEVFKIDEKIKNKDKIKNNFIHDTVNNLQSSSAPRNNSELSRYTKNINLNNPPNTLAQVGKNITKFKDQISIKMDYMEHIGVLFCNKRKNEKEKKDLYDKVIKLTNRKLNIEYLLNKYIQLDQMRNLLYDSEKLKFLDNHPNFLLFLENKSEVKNLSDRNQHFISDFLMEEKIIIDNDAYYFQSFDNLCEKEKEKKLAVSHFILKTIK